MMGSGRMVHRDSHKGQLRRCALTLGLAAIIAWAGSGWAQEYTRAYESASIRVLDVACEAHSVGLEFIVPMFEERYGINAEVDDMPFPRVREATILVMIGRTGRHDVFSIDVMWLAEYGERVS